MTENRVAKTGLFITALLLTNTGLADVQPPDDQRVNPVLIEHQATLVPGLKPLGSNVYGAEFHGYSNFGFIDTDDGVVVVDAGWFPTPTANALALLRKHTDKPIAAVIYTHLHPDHYGGIQAILPESGRDIPVYGPAGWQQWVANSQGADQRTFLRRAFLQMGVVLPEGQDGTVGNGIGPSPRLEPYDALSYPPTIDVDSPMSLSIGGVDIEILPAEGDVNEHLWVWLPEERILFVGDSPPHGVFPAVETARFEIGRDPQLMLESVQEAIDLQPNAIIPGHSRILDDPNEIQELMALTRDAIQFLIDQVDRFYLSDRSIDDLLDTLHLPPAIANHPDLQPYYHRWEWMMQQRFLKRAGFIDDWMDYLSHHAIDEARRLVPLLGGRDAVLAHSSAALDSDPRWAARLAHYVLLVDPADRDARILRQSASQKVAQRTTSTNQRNYLLGLIREENAEVNFDRLLAGPVAASLNTQSTPEILSRLRTRFIAEAADHIDIRVRVSIADDTLDLVVANNLLKVSWPDTEKAPDAEWQLSRATLVQLVSKQKTLTELIDSGDIAVAGSTSHSNQLTALIE